MLLTIAIPTYNRVNYVQLCLEAIIEQLYTDLHLINYIDILILDNNSDDDTNSIVRSIIDRNRDLNIDLIKNEINLGLDGNITKSFETATGDFVWIFGDDDVLIPGSLKKIIALLKDNKTCGNIYVNHYGFTTNYKAFIPGLIDSRYDIYHSNLAYFYRVNYYFTYTTGNIINKKLLPANFNSKRFLGTNLNLLSWIITAIFQSTYNIVVEDRLIAMKIENTGGYGFCETFGTNGNQLFNKFINDGIPKKYFDIINNKMLVSFFPSLLISVKNNRSLKFTNENHMLILRDVYRRNFRFWLFCWPIISTNKSKVAAFPFINKLYGILTKVNWHIFKKIAFLSGKIEHKNVSYQ